MDRYIGLDAHASSSTVATVGPSGRRLHSQVVETNAGALIRVLRGIPGTRHLCLEEGTHASWLYEVLYRYGDPRTDGVMERAFEILHAAAIQPPPWHPACHARRHTPPPNTPPPRPESHAAKPWIVVGRVRGLGLASRPSGRPG